MRHETRVQPLLNSPVGCALVLDVLENRRLPLEYFAEPKVSSWLAASAMDFMDPYADGHGGLNQRMALRDARAHETLALSLARIHRWDSVEVVRLGTKGEERVRQGVDTDGLGRAMSVSVAMRGF